MGATKSNIAVAVIKWSVFLMLVANNLVAADPPQSPSARLFSAAAVAYADFGERILSKQKEGDLGMFFSKVSNYEITIVDNGATCTVSFGPRAFQGNRVRGGGAYYVVEIDTGKIIDFGQYR